jgi:PAS domain S-box-containing protein
MPLALFYPLALELVGAIAKVHARHLLHGALHPADVLKLRDGRVELIGFGRVDCSHASLPPSSPFASRPYLSPEQIGRHPHVADERSDLYSLGVILFEMLAGTPPFQASELIGWVHAHCALPPPPLTALVDDVPPCLSAIVTKLLAKAPEARYQTAGALHADLARSFEAWKAGREAESFPLASDDHPPSLRVSGAIHGRRNETRRVRLAVTRTSRPRPAEIVLLSGPAGIGKTSIVQDALRELTTETTPPLVASGHCRPTTSIMPAAPLVEAFGHALRASIDVASGTSALGAELKEALGPDLPLLCVLIPELARIVQAPARRGEPLLPETETRLFCAIDRLVATFSSTDRPLVLVLEDLHWCDPVTLDVIGHWAKATSGPPVVVLGTFRDGEASLRSSLDRMIAGGAPIEELRVGPLAPDGVAEWVADMLRGTQEQVAPLARTIDRITGGTPLFVARVMEALHEQRCVEWDGSARQWRWRLDEKLLSSPPFASVTALLDDQLRRLSPEAREALGCLAAYGPKIEPETLGLVLGCPAREAVDRLSGAFDAKLVSRSGGAICFVHACVADAAYATLGDERARERTHLRVGRALLESVDSGRDATQIFEVIAQLAHTGPELESDAERARVAALHLAAACRVQATTHFRAAVPLLLGGLALLGDGRAWDTEPTLAFRLTYALARSRMAIGEAEPGRSLARELHARARDAEERTSVHLLVAELDASVDAQAAAAECLAGLRELGLDLPQRPSEEAGERADRALARVEPEAILHLERSSDPTTRAIGELLASLLLPAILTDTSALLAAAAAAADRFLDTGYANGASLAFFTLAMRHAQVGRVSEARLLGQAAYALAKRDEAAATRPREALYYLGSLGQLAQPVRDCARQLSDELEIARAVGDRPFIALLAKEAARFRLFAGDALEDVACAAAEAVALARETHSAVLERHVGHLSRLVERLRDASAADALGPLEPLPPGAPHVERSEHLSYELVARFILGDHAGAARAADLADAAFGAADAIGALHVQFFGALAFARAAVDGGASLLAAFDARLDTLRTLAAECPVNFGARAALVAAERGRLAGDVGAAEEGYETAIRLARAAGQHHIEAIASECAAHFYGEAAVKGVADAYLIQAHACYEVWGARAKAARLLRDHAFLAERPVLAPDLAAVLEAQRALTSTLRLPELCQRVVEVAIEHAKAQRGCLLWTGDGRELVLGAASGTSADAFGAEGATASELHLPLSMCHAAVRLKKPTLVADTVVENRYSFDPYFADARARMRSALCLPIVRDDVVIAVVYLENDVVPGLFSPTELAILDSISAQAGISLDNARVHTRVEHENEELRAAEIALSRRQRLFEAALDATPLIVQIKDLGGRYLFVNRRYEEVFNLESSQLLGKSDFDLFPRAAADAVRALDRRALAEERAIEVDETVPHGDDLHSYRTVEFPLRDEDGRTWATCAFASDYTRRRIAEEELRRTLSLLEATFESTQSGILVIDREERIIRYNRRFLALWPIPDGVLHAGDGFREMLSLIAAHLEDPCAFVARIDELQRDPEQEATDILRLKDGRVYERTVMPQRLGGIVVGRVINVHDVTDKVKAAEERTRLLAEEKRARAEAEDAVHARDEFLSIASHELRTPLASLSLAVETLASPGTEEMNPERVRRAATIAKRQVQRIVSLIEMLLDVSRLRSGKLVLSPTPVDLRAVVEEVGALLASELARSGSRLEVHAPDPVIGHFDALRIEQVVTNLLTNAIKFGRGAPIEVDVSRADSRARLVVADRGIGIPTEPRARIFEPFTRLVSPRHFGGLGLGLHITKSIVEAHGGTLDVESEEGVGSRFIVTLPLNHPAS